jgi:hypothetical protein
MHSVRRWSVPTVELGVLAASAPASADLVEYPRNPSATPLARAKAGDPAIERHAIFSALPPRSKPAAEEYPEFVGDVYNDAFVARARGVEAMRGATRAERGSTAR